MSRYTVWSVGRDGNVEHLDSLHYPEDALRKKESMDRLYSLAGVTRKVGITDNEYPEGGDVSDRLAEEDE